MTTPAIIGIDLGKRSFHLHAQTRHGKPLFRKALSRQKLLSQLAQQPACRVVMESCAGSHYWARQLQALGHDVRLIPPQYVKPFVKTNKNDFVDAEAICEAASRPTMRFAAIKSEDQQILSALHRTRQGLVAERTAIMNRLHGFLLEFGVALPVGHAAIRRLAAYLEGLPPAFVALAQRLQGHYTWLSDEITILEKMIEQHTRCNDSARRLMTVPGIGPITASAIVGAVGDASHYRSGREFAASLGLVPRQYATGGKPRLLGISKRGDGHLRRLLVQGARAVMQRQDQRHDRLGGWLRELGCRRHSNVVACALANKLARIAWAILAKGGEFRPSPGATLA